MKLNLLNRLALCILLVLLPTTESLASAGKFNFVAGDVRVVNAAGERKATRGSEVEVGESIVSGTDGMAQLRMSDGAFIAVRADTELRIDEYHFAGTPDASSNSVFSLLKGTMRAFTGAIASFNKDKFKMKTATATIGIRGSGNVLNFAPENKITLNHTIVGSHSVTAVDLSGAVRTLVTLPGQTVQVSPGGVMRFVPTPAFILNAAAGAPSAKPEQKQQKEETQPKGKEEQQSKEKQSAEKQSSEGKEQGKTQPAETKAAGTTSESPSAKTAEAGQSPSTGTASTGTAATGTASSGPAPTETASTGIAVPAPPVPAPPAPAPPAPAPVAPTPVAPTYTAPTYTAPTYTAPTFTVASDVAAQVAAQTAAQVAAQTAAQVAAQTAALVAAQTTAETTAQVAGQVAACTANPESCATVTCDAACVAAKIAACTLNPASCTTPANICIAPLVWNGISCIAPAAGNCVAPLVWNGTSCLAPTAASCPAPLVWNGISCISSTVGNCIAPTVWNGTSCAAPTVVSCVPPMFWDGKTCVGSTVGSCVPPMVWDGKACVALTTTDLVAAVIAACTANPGACATATCDAACVVAKIAACTLNPASCIIPANICVAPMVWNGTTCIAPTGGNCVAPMVWDGKSCIAPTVGNCIAPMIWNGTACVASTAPPATCIAPMIWNGTACVAQTVGSCVAPMVWDAATSTCVASTAGSCVAPMVWDGKSCIAPTVGNCIAPMIWNGTACVASTAPPATCVAPMIWNGTACVAQTVGSCVAPMVWNAATSTCVANPYPWAYDANGNLLSGYTLVNGVPTLTTAVAGGACTGAGAGNISGSLYCDGATWITPAVGTACTGTVTVGSFTCTNGIWATTTPTCINGFVLNGTGTACECPTPKFVDTATGNCVTSPTAGKQKTYPLTYATAPAPDPGMMYDAFGVQVPIPAEGYRNVGYVHSLTGDTTAEIALNQASAVTTASSGALTSFNTPSFDGAAVASSNQFNIGIGTATLMDFGTDPVSGMSWGRWQGGQISRISVESGQVVAIAQGAGSTHWFASPTQTQAITLPLTGIIPYTLVGGTTPTDAGGNLGTLNSASFTANFTNSTVDVGLNLSMPAIAGPTPLPAVTINAGAFGIPIMPGANFRANYPNIDCPACTGVTSGTIAGQFSGPGGLGVGVGYGFKNGPQIINGAVVFRK